MIKKTDPEKIKEYLRQELGEDIYSKIELMSFEKAEMMLKILLKHDANSKLIKGSASVRDIIRESVMNDSLENTYQLVEHCKAKKMYSFDIVRFLNQNMPTESEMEGILEKQTQEAYFSSRKI